MYSCPMLPGMRTWGTLGLCLTACSDIQRADVGTHRERPDGGADVEHGIDAASSGSRAQAVGSMPEVLFTSNTGVEVDLVSVDGDAVSTFDAGSTEAVTASERDGSPSAASTTEAGMQVDAAAQTSDLEPPLFVIPEEEDCSGVQFVDPVRACDDLAGLSLANPLLVTDADGRWNPGDVASLDIDLLGAEREGESFYDSPAIVATFDADSAAFASVSWRNTEVFGILAGQKHRHRIEVSLTEGAPPGTRVWLHLEPATSNGHTTTCDCDGVEVTGLTLSFEVR